MLKSTNTRYEQAHLIYNQSSFGMFKSIKTLLKRKLSRRVHPKSDA